MVEVLDDVEVEWQHRFAFVRLEAIKLIEDRNLGDVTKR